MTGTQLLGKGRQMRGRARGRFAPVSARVRQARDLARFVWYRSIVVMSGRPADPA
jgi:hypothetical protein